MVVQVRQRAPVGVRDDLHVESAGHEAGDAQVHPRATPRQATVRACADERKLDEALRGGMMDDIRPRDRRAFPSELGPEGDELRHVHHDPDREMRDGRDALSMLSA